MNDPSSEEKLRHAWKELADLPIRGIGCPDPDRIWEAQEGKLGRGEVRRIVRHTSTCPACAELWRLAHAMGALEAREASPVPARPFFWRVPLAVAAGLVLVAAAIGIGTWIGSGKRNPEPIYRSNDQGVIRSLVSEQQPVPREACTLRWTPGPAGTRYTLRLTDQEFVEIFSVQALENAEVQIPAEVLAKITSKARLMWQVQAFFPDGSHEVSPTYFVTIE